MVTRARFSADLVSTVNANTSSPANAIFISSGGDVTIANSITVGGNIPGFVQNTYLYSTFAQNTATTNLFDDRLQVANAATTYVTKSVHLTSNNALINLINDRIQIANADAAYVTKSVALSSNTALVGLINDRLQVANLTSELSSYWPSANAIAYINANATGGDMTVNTSIFVASGGETSVAVPVTSNGNLIQVYLNGFALSRSIDWTANSTHIKNIEALAAGDIVQVHEYKMHPANTLNRSAGGGGGGGGFQGSSFGFASSQTGPAGPSPYNGINKWPFSSDTNATEVSDYSPTGPRVYTTAGQSSATDAYSTGSLFPLPGNPSSNDILKFPFASGGPATDVGDLSVRRSWSSGQSSQSAGFGYTAGGFISPTRSNVIDKFPFSSDGNATDVGDLTTAILGSTGQSSPTHGYRTGGGPGGPPSAPGAGNVIDKFPFSSDANATDVGDLVGVASPSQPGLTDGTGNSSDSNGYVSNGCGINPAGTNYQWSNVIQKFPFSSDTNASDIADVAVCTQYAAGASSTANGYVAGGYGGAPGSDRINNVQKFPFSSDANATDVLDLAVVSQTHVGNQV